LKQSFKQFYKKIKPIFKDILGNGALVFKDIFGSGAVGFKKGILEVLDVLGDFVPPCSVSSNPREEFPFIIN
jgi:hypothetical protein